MCPIHGVAPYPEARAASIAAAGKIQAAATPNLQLAPNDFLVIGYDLKSSDLFLTLSSCATINKVS